MKKILATLSIVLFSCIFASAQTATSATTYTREGDTFVQSKSDSLLMKGDQITAYKWQDKSGNEYPIILHTYSRGEKAGRTTAYVIRVSKKTGKEYRYFLPDGEKIAGEIIRENN